MFRKNETTDQTTLKVNYNQLAKQLGLPLLTGEGFCGGLTIAYLIFAQENNLNQFYDYIFFTRDLTPIKINTLFQAYQKNKDLKIQFNLSIDNKQTQTIEIDFSDYIKFIKKFSDLQSLRNNITIKSANWERTISFICQETQLTSVLQNIPLSPGTHMVALIGNHTFAIRYEAAGFYIFEPNNIEKPSPLTLEQVSKKMISNYYLLITRPLTDATIAISIKLFTYTCSDEERNLHRAVVHFNRAYSYPQINTLITDYLDSNISRMDLAVSLKLLIEYAPQPLCKELQELASMINVYLNNDKIKITLNLIRYMLTYNNAITRTANYSNTSLLDVATMGNQLWLVREIILLSKRINHKLNLTFSFFFSITFGHIEIIKLLLNENVDVNQKGIGGWAPIHYAIGYGDTEILKLLLNARVDINQKNITGRAPIHSAILKNNIEIFKLLLNANVDVHQKDIKGWAPIHYAVNNRHQILELLITRKGIDLKILSGSGVSPLHLAIKYGYIEIVKLLLDTKKVDVNANGPNNDTPLRFAVKFNRQEIVKLLLDAGANVNMPNSNGNTPLHVAAACNYDTIFQILISHGANVNVFFNALTKRLLQCTSHKNQKNELEKFLKQDNFFLPKAIPFSILHAAAFFGCEKIIILLFDKINTFPKKTIAHACALAKIMNHTEIVNALESMENKNSLSSHKKIYSI